VEGSLPKGERQRLAALAAATANGLLLHMAAALEPQSVWHQSRRLLVRRCSRAVMVAFLLLLPLQGLAA
jgi:hypothetical protein